MSPSTVHRRFLDTFVGAHVGTDFVENDGDRMLDFSMNMQGSASIVLAEIKELKDNGNEFYRQNEFDMAAACYDEACNLLSLSLGNIEGEDIQSISGLAVSLISNMAACALKLGEYKAASGMCSMILGTFPHNVKALFRRAMAYMKLKRFTLAELDLVQALAVEPNNKDALRELEVVKGRLLIKENGKRVLEVASETCVDGKNKKPAQELGSDVGIKGSESVITEVVEEKGDMNIQDDEKVDMEDHESVKMVETDAHSACGGDVMTSLNTNELNSTKPMLEFSKKGGGSSRLSIPSQSYKKMLLDGKTLSFYRKHDYSTLTIRILKDEDIKESDFTRELYRKKKKKRRCKKRRISKVMEDVCEDMTYVESINVQPAISGVSLSVSSPGIVSSSAYPTSENSSHENSSPIDHSDTTNHQPFLFTACSKKCKSYSIEKSSCAQCTPMFFRYSSSHHVRKKWSMARTKKNHSQGDESPRHNLFTFSKSKPLSHKSLRPRGVSVSRCRYSLEAQTPKKRKYMASSTYYFQNSLKKPRALNTPTPSLFSCNNNVMLAPDVEMSACLV